MSLSLIEKRIEAVTKELEQSYFVFNNTEDQTCGGKLDSIIYKIKSLELELNELLRSFKKIEKEPIETPKKIKNLLSKTVYHLKLIK